jgi:hypothetical protein
MVTDEKLRKEAKAAVSKFCKDFYLTYGVYPTVLYTLSKTKIRTISLKNAEDLVNTVLQRTYADDYEVRSKTRLKHIIIYRHVMFKILYDMGYTYTVLAGYFKYSHATILYASNTITNYLKFNDQKTIEVYNIIKNEITKENEPDAVIQHDNRGEVIT